MWAGVAGVVVLLAAVFALWHRVVEEYWLRKLEHGDEKTRNVAMERLAEIGSSYSFPRIVTEYQRRVPKDEFGLNLQALEDWRLLRTLRAIVSGTSPEVGGALTILHEWLGSRVRRPRSAIAAVEYGHYTASQHAPAYVASALGASSVPELSGWLQDSDAFLRACTASVLGELKENASGATAQLADHMTDPGEPWYVRAACVSAFGSIVTACSRCDPEAALLLARAAMDPQVEVRFRAVRCLGEMGVRAEPARSSLLEISKADRAGNVRRAAVEVLEKIESANAPPR